MRKKIKKGKAGVGSSTPGTTRKLLEKGSHVSTPVTSVNNTPQRALASAQQPLAFGDVSNTASTVDSPLGNGERGRRALFSPTLAEVPSTLASTDAIFTEPGKDGWL